MYGRNSRQHHGHSVVGDTRDCEGKQCSSRKTQSVDLALQRLSHLLESRFNCPTIAIDVGNLDCSRFLLTQISQNGDGRVSISRWYIKLHFDATNTQDFSLIRRQLEFLLIHFAGFAPADIASRTDSL